MDNLQALFKEIALVQTDTIRLAEQVAKDRIRMDSLKQELADLQIRSSAASKELEDLACNSAAREIGLLVACKTHKDLVNKAFANM